MSLPTTWVWTSARGDGDDRERHLEIHSLIASTLRQRSGVAADRAALWAVPGIDVVTPAPGVYARRRATRPGRCIVIAPPRVEVNRMQSNRPSRHLQALGQSLWLDNIKRGLLDNGGLRRYIDEQSITGLTSNPTIFDHAIKGSADYDDDDPRRRQRGQVRRSAVLRARDRRHPARGRPVPADPRRARTASTAGSRSKSRRCSPYDTQATIAAATRSARARRAAEPVHQDPGHAGRPAGDRGGDLRRRAGQRHAAVLRARSIVAAAEAYLRGIERRIDAGPVAVRRVGGVAVRQPLGRRGRGQGARRAAHEARHRRRAAGLRGVRRRSLPRRAGSA